MQEIKQKIKNKTLPRDWLLMDAIVQRLSRLNVRKKMGIVIPPAFG